MPDWKIAPTQLVTSNLITMIKAALPGSRGYDHNVPVDAELPYWMLTHIPGGGFSGPPLTAPHVDAELVFQIDGVGARRDQAQWIRDKVIEVLLARSLSGSLVNPLTMPSGWVECDRMPEEGSGGVEQEGAPPHVTYTAPQRFTVVVTPTS